MRANAFIEFSAGRCEKPILTMEPWVKDCEKKNVDKRSGRKEEIIFFRHFSKVYLQEYSIRAERAFKPKWAVAHQRSNRYFSTWTSSECMSSSERGGVNSQNHGSERASESVCITIDSAASSSSGNHDQIQSSFGIRSAILLCGRIGCLVYIACSLVWRHTVIITILRKFLLYANGGIVPISFIWSALVPFAHDGRGEESGNESFHLIL